MEIARNCKNIGYIPVVPPQIKRRYAWNYAKEMYKNRNEIKRYFRRIKKVSEEFLLATINWILCTPNSFCFL